MTHWPADPCNSHTAFAWRGSTTSKYLQFLVQEELVPRLLEVQAWTLNSQPSMALQTQPLQSGSVSQVVWPRASSACSGHTKPLDQIKPFFPRLFTDKHPVEKTPTCWTSLTSLKLPTPFITSLKKIISALTWVGRSSESYSGAIINVRLRLQRCNY